MRVWLGLGRTNTRWASHMCGQTRTDFCTCRHAVAPAGNHRQATQEPKAMSLTPFCGPKTVFWYRPGFDWILSQRVSDWSTDALRTPAHEDALGCQVVAGDPDRLVLRRRRSAVLMAAGLHRPHEHHPAGRYQSGRMYT